MASILFIGAHPDDVELGCLGTISTHAKKKDQIFVVIATDGERGNHDPKKYNRVDESINCLAKVGVPKKNVVSLHFPDTMLYKYRDAILNKIEEICRKNKIDTIFVNSNKDYHQDHVVLFEETMRAARHVHNILAYESNSSTLSTFSPNYFVDITNFIDKKVEFLRLHESQYNKYFIKDSTVRSLAKFRGGQIKSNGYAEGFEVLRMVIQ